MNPLLIRRRGMMQAAGGAMVKIEYLERTSGNSYINIPVIARKGVRVEVDFQKTTTVQNNFLFGAYVSNEVCIQCYTGQNAIWRYGSISHVISTNNTTRHIAVMDDGSFSLDGNLIRAFSVGNFNTNLPITLFGRNSSGAFVGKIFAAKITDVDDTLYDLIPVRIGTVGYMYDRVSGQLFGNLGTGDFILGSDIP